MFWRIPPLTLLALLLGLAPAASATVPIPGVHLAKRVRQLPVDPKTGQPTPEARESIAMDNYIYVSRGAAEEWTSRSFTRRLTPKNAWIYGIDDSNKRYHLTAELPAQPKGGTYALVLNWTDFIVATGSGSSNGRHTYTFRLTRVQADRAAKTFKLVRRDRLQLGKHLDVAFSAQATRVGAPVLIKATITNVGTIPVVAPMGGAYRGSGRNNRFTLTVRRGKTTLPDIGSKLNLGGLATIPVLKPGDSQTVQADAAKWAKLDTPGEYTVEVTYELEANIPDRPGVREPWPARAHEYWTGKRSGKVTFTLRP